MTNKAMAELISQHLSKGLPHPGYPETGQPAVSIPLPAFRTAGMHPEMAKEITVAGTMIGESIVNLIETVGDSVIISRAELDNLRVADQQPGVPMPVICAACREPVVWLAVTNGRAVIHTQHLLGGIVLDCPHRAIT